MGGDVITLCDDGIINVLLLLLHTHQHTKLTITHQTHPFPFPPTHTTTTPHTHTHVRTHHTTPAGGRLYTFGNNSHGKLGHNDLKDRLIPTKVKAFDSIVVEEVGCGVAHAVAVISKWRCVYYFIICVGGMATTIPSHGKLGCMMS